MPIYHAPLEQIRFLLTEVFGDINLAELPGYGDATPDMVEAILTEGAKLCENEFFPLNQSGDMEGCTFHDDGSVTTPTGFDDAYDKYVTGGWAGLSADPDYGGQGLPQVINTIMAELISSANLSLGMYPGLTQGAINAIAAHGSDEQKQTYLPPMINGRWSGTMNLTEPQCGTDLGLIRATADPNDDGSYNITGTKIYISAGEHDLTDNIIHLVLARLPDAPSGTKGISMFVVPKFMVKDDGSLGDKNAVECGSIEEKMGIHAASTCVMNYDGATGWLVGQPNKGLRAMFTMMNEARLHVGMQGLGLMEVAYQNAVEYAGDRLQGRALDGVKNPSGPADPIIVHPDVRKNLLTMRTVIEPARALAVKTGMEIDLHLKHPDESRRQRADDFVALMTPIIKALYTDLATEVTNLGVQVHGGAGYIADYGVEQYVRDARITQIYEGANGIQALDLVGRKLGKSYGRLLRRFFHPVQDDLDQWMKAQELSDLVFPFAKAFAKLQQATVTIAQKGLRDKNEGAAVSTDYLAMFGYVILGYYWIKIVRAAEKQTGQESPQFYASKKPLANYYMQKILPRAVMHFKSIMAGKDPIMALPQEAF